MLVAIRGLRRFLGEFHWDEWDECATHLGLTVYEAKPEEFDGEAALAGKVLILGAEDEDSVRAWRAWHEIGHAVLHSQINRVLHFLTATDPGAPAVEVQANIFAALFPTWDLDYPMPQPGKRRRKAPHDCRGRRRGAPWRRRQAA